MTAEHERWIAQAVELSRAKRYDEAREYALRVVREDGRNAKALWIVASTTGSLTERRNTLKALLRVQPENLHAQNMLNSIEQEIKAHVVKSTSEVRSIKPAPAPQHVLLYAAVALAALVIVAAAVAVAAGI